MSALSTASSTSNLTTALNEAQPAAGPALLALLYCEFHPTLGPELVQQVPPGFYSPQHFTNVKKYVITKPELSSRIVAM